MKAFMIISALANIRTGNLPNMSHGYRFTISLVVRLRGIQMEIALVFVFGVNSSCGFFLIATCQAF
jgi:hypothetical protein